MNLPWFVVGYYFYPTRYVFSITLPRLRDKNTLDVSKSYPTTNQIEILYLFISIMFYVVCYLWYYSKKILWSPLVDVLINTIY